MLRSGTWQIFLNEKVFRSGTLILILSTVLFWTWMIRQKVKNAPFKMTLRSKYNCSILERSNFFLTRKCSGAEPVLGKRLCSIATTYWTTQARCGKRRSRDETLATAAAAAAAAPAHWGKMGRRAHSGCMQVM